MRAKWSSLIFVLFSLYSPAASSHPDCTLNLSWSVVVPAGVAARTAWLVRGGTQERWWGLYRDQHDPNNVLTVWSWRSDGTAWSQRLIPGQQTIVSAAQVRIVLQGTSSSSRGYFGPCPG
jgi:hypothetical protein